MREFGSPLSGFGSPLLRRRGGLLPLTDADAAAYIAAVEAEDGQALEVGVRAAVDAFVIGCKADGIWDAIKASCILAGARTLSGALVPLVGPTPTNNGPFVDGDYNRITGLKGDGLQKYLNSNRANNADPQNSKHLSVYVSTVSTGEPSAIIGTSNEQGRATIFRGNSGINGNIHKSGGPLSFPGASIELTGLYALSRGDFDRTFFRIGGAAGSFSSQSEMPSGLNIHVFSLNPIGFYSNARLSFYSIGKNLDLLLLDNRVSTLMNAISGALS